MASVNTITQTTPSVERVAGIFLNEILDSVSLNIAGMQYLKARDKFALVSGGVSGMVQPYSDDPTATGTSLLADEEFTITKKSIMHKVAYDIFKNTQWKDAIANLKDQGLPREFQEFLAGDTAKQANADVEKEFWMGNSDLVGSPTGAGFINGFYKIISDKLTAASKTSQIVALGANEDPTDPTKVQAAFDKIVAAMPKTLVGARAKVRFFVSPLVEQAHRRSLQLQLASNLPNVNPLVHNTYELIVVPNLDDKTIIVGKPENMAIATAVDGDLVEINVVDQFALGLGNFARVFGNFGYGVGAATTDFVIATGTAENN